MIGGILNAGVAGVPRQVGPRYVFAQVSGVRFERSMRNWMRREVMV